MSAVGETEEAAREPAACSGARALLETLLSEGVDTVFGYPGGAVLPIYDELAKMSDRLRHVLARHEQGAIHMAEGYAKASGRIGVALVTSGPGVTNAMTGIANAYLDSTPIVVITGQVPRKMIGTDAFQEIDTVGITRSCTKANYLVAHADEIEPIVREACYIAASGRPGPVVIDVPKDVSAEPLGDRVARPLLLSGYRPAVPGDERSVRAAVDLLFAAERPVLYVGGGVVHSGGTRELTRLAERLNVPVTPTLMGLGCFPTTHPLCLGMLGMHGTYAANMAISEADLIIALGVRFDDRVTGALDRFAPDARIVHVDIDPSSLDKNVRTSVAIEGDAKTVTRQILAMIPGFADATRLVSWWRRIDAWRDFAPLSYEPSGDVILPQQLCEELSRLTNGDAIVTTDVGQHQMWLAQYYPFRRPRQSITSGGLGAMGFGFPAAVGAQIAHADRLVIAFVGDGGFQMTAQELTTAVQYEAPVKVVILNNGFLGMVRQWQEAFYEDRYSHVDISSSPDFVKLAEAYGAVGMRISSPETLAEDLARGLATPGVVVMDIVVAPEENVFPLVPPGAGLQEMVLR